MQAGVTLLATNEMPIYMIAMNNIITTCFSINCPTVICLLMSLEATSVFPQRGRDDAAQL